MARTPRVEAKALNKLLADTEKLVIEQRNLVDSGQVGGTHYRQGYTQQHWDYAWERKFDQFQYNITKRIERWRKKDGLQDLYKARQELDKYIELIEAEQATSA